ncbi:hypothetical protein [Candidatus Gromoviella agglomerans]|uniref:hypothetical protein n=1 Tax=Candidatus Gromoviella agglomerans TaxID=2806609 RepID=UPI001E582389|nr:hypothetical protein [Candidatus Gromoviella agglomerans]UFX98492.1 hypothetical protein Gromo_00402 [Candidatus Gromoviella agglomerans]
MKFDYIVVINSELIMVYSAQPFEMVISSADINRVVKFLKNRHVIVLHDDSLTQSKEIKRIPSTIGTFEKFLWKRSIKKNLRDYYFKVKQVDENFISIVSVNKSACQIIIKMLESNVVIKSISICTCIEIEMISSYVQANNGVLMIIKMNSKYAKHILFSGELFVDRIVKLQEQSEMFTQFFLENDIRDTIHYATQIFSADYITDELVDNLQIVQISSNAEIENYSHPNYFNVSVDEISRKFGLSSKNGEYLSTLAEYFLYNNKKNNLQSSLYLLIKFKLWFVLAIVILISTLLLFMGANVNKLIEIANNKKAGYETVLLKRQALQKDININYEKLKLLSEFIEYRNIEFSIYQFFSNMRIALGQHIVVNKIKMIFHYNEKKEVRVKVGLICSGQDFGRLASQLQDIYVDKIHLSEDKLCDVDAVCKRSLVVVF